MPGMWFEDEASGGKQLYTTVKHSLIYLKTFFFLAPPLSLWDLSYPTKDGTHTPGRESTES